MAIFVIFAWIMEAAVAIGLVEPDPKDPNSRAYRVANRAMERIKSELLSTRIEYRDEGCIVSHRVDGTTATLTCRDGGVYRRLGEDESERRILFLGEGGFLRFSPMQRGKMSVSIEARTANGGVYKLEVDFQVGTRPT